MQRCIRLPDHSLSSSETLENVFEYATGAPSDEVISDPYGYTMLAYRSSARQLLGYIEQTLNRLDGQVSTSSRSV